MTRDAKLTVVMNYYDRRASVRQSLERPYGETECERIHSINVHLHITVRQHHCNHCNINDVIVCCAHTICNVIMPVQCLVSSVTKRRICSIFLFYYDKVCERVMSVIEKSTMSTLCLKKVVGLHQTHGNNFCQLLTDFQNVLIPAFHRTCWWKIFYRFCWKFTSLSIAVKEF